MSSPDGNVYGVCFGIADISFSYLFTIINLFTKWFVKCKCQWHQGINAKHIWEQRLRFKTDWHM